MPDYFFCTNCGGEFSLSDLKFTICKNTNHVMGICPICKWNEFTKEESDLQNFEVDYQWPEYPEQKFYLEV